MATVHYYKDLFLRMVHYILLFVDVRWRAHRSHRHVHLKVSLWPKPDRPEVTVRIVRGKKSELKYIFSSGPEPLLYETVFCI